MFHLWRERRCLSACGLRRSHARQLRSHEAQATRLLENAGVRDVAAEDQGMLASVYGETIVFGTVFAVGADTCEQVLLKLAVVHNLPDARWPAHKDNISCCGPTVRRIVCF